tara:strand:- start:478 stop:1638 length:1161 start_codon:yes stop_codon:yes gene_type:complete
MSRKRRRTEPYEIKSVLAAQFTRNISNETKSKIELMEWDARKIKKGEIRVKVFWAPPHNHSEWIDLKDCCYQLNGTCTNNIDSIGFQNNIIWTHLNSTVKEYNQSVNNSNGKVLALMRCSNAKLQMETKRSPHRQLKAAIAFARRKNYELDIFFQNGTSGGWKKKNGVHDFCTPYNITRQSFLIWIGGLQFDDNGLIAPISWESSKNYFEENNIKAFYALNVDRLTRSTHGMTLMWEYFVKRNNIPMYFGTTKRNDAHNPYLTSKRHMKEIFHQAMDAQLFEMKCIQNAENDEDDDDDDADDGSDAESDAESDADDDSDDDSDSSDDDSDDDSDSSDDDSDAEVSADDELTSQNVMRSNKRTRRKSAPGLLAALTETLSSNFSISQ